MEKYKIAKRTLWWIAIITFVIVELIGLCFGKVIEGNLFGEIAKWVVMGILLAGLMAGLSYTLVGILVSRKNAGLDKKK